MIRSPYKGGDRMTWVLHDLTEAVFTIPETANEKDLENLRKFTEIVINRRLKELKEKHD